MATTPNTLVVDSFNLGSLGLIWSSRPGWDSTPRIKNIQHDLPGRPGTFFQQQSIDLASRITVGGHIFAVDMATLQTNMDLIKARLRGTVQIEFSDDTSRAINANIVELAIRDLVSGAVTPMRSYTLTLECPDPLKFTKSADSHTHNVDCPIGTAEVRPIVTINAVTTNPTTIEVRNSSNVAVSSFTMAAALASGESFIINSRTGQVQKDDGVGGITSALADFSGSFPVLRPEDADFVSSSWGKLFMTAGDASPDISVDYNKTWW